MKGFFRQSLAAAGRYALVILPFVVALVAVLVITAHVVQFNPSPSMPLGWYLRVPAWNIEVGDIVEFDNPLSEGTFGVDTSTGIFKRVEAIEDGMYRVKGDHPMSYDSRYFGLIGREYIRNELKPLATFSELPEWMRKIADLRIFDI